SSFCMCFFVQTNHTRKELLFLMFKEINLRNHSSLHKLFYSLKIQELTDKTVDLIVENMGKSRKEAEQDFQKSDTYVFLWLAKRNIENEHPIILYRMFNSELKAKPIDEEQQSFIDFMTDNTIELITQNTNWGR
ncbi:hypothetical protein, partial [Lactobacillus crispatus]